ncbi:MAG: Gfo/Idh/MocA family oxidoreductase [Woeseiaceae bacterium]|nr:Gfo/Idh/MocA family oxidoreductase [Woeseiaceae bacterium]
MIRIGLLGASRIGRGAIIAPAAEIAGVEVVTVAARSEARAREYAEVHGIPKVEPDYQALISSPEIDLVYNALPPSEHKGWTLAALRAGKHVLCEKPFSMNADEAEAMVGTAKETGRTLIEAFHCRFHPLFARVMELLDSGAIGTVLSMSSHFNVPIPSEPGELRYDKRLGGGAMMDLGCYPVHWVRNAAAEEPDVVSANADWHESGVDVAMEAELQFPLGATASVSCSMSENLPDKLDANLTVTGEEGTLAVDNPLAPHIGHELTLETDRGVVSEQFGSESTYHYQLRHTVDVIENGATQLTGGADAIGNMRVIDAIYRVAAGGRP